MNTETLQKLSTPIAIVVAGALIASAMIYNNSGTTGGERAQGPVWEKQTIAKLQNDDHVRGDRNAKVLLVEYSDTECPFCKVFHKTAQQIVEKYDGKVAWVYRHFPLEQLHPKAKKEAEAMECVASLSNEETFWKYADMIYDKTGANNKLDIGVYNTPSPTPRDPQTGKPYYTEKKPRSTTDAGQLSDFAVALGVDKAQFEQCMQESRFATRVQRDLDDVIKAGGTGTPTSYIVVKGKQFKIEGAQPLEAVVKVIDDVL